ncbi:MAG: lipid-A-disaccharide synthase [Chitinivibrionales bacterium]|nr:lipid-A-disaccharide synthase [Chitinivibrionales bacterium]MBD3357100.1 lipid-A-disaccharide synthase [Chitinivibrionales bacterium]
MSFTNRNSGSPSVMFIAGDPSGDVHAGAVVARLKQKLPHLECFGIGGSHMERHGFKPLMPFAPFNRMGFVEVLCHLGFFLRAKRVLVEEMKRRCPRALVCVDYPGFNIAMMKAAHECAIPVVWYIAPKVWAWKKKRAPILGEHATHIAAIFPFETEIFAPYNAPVTYVGNPLVEALDQRKGILEPIILDNRKARENGERRSWRLALVPGSRNQEICAILPVLLETVNRLKRERPDVSFSVRVSQRTEMPAELYRACDEITERHTGPLDELLAWCDSALVTSGTATLEAALVGKPFVIVYRTSALSFAAYRIVRTIPFVGLPNILAGKEIVRECLQDQCRPEILAGEITALIDSPQRYHQAEKNLQGIADMLGSLHPSRAVSEIVADLV